MNKVSIKTYDDLVSEKQRLEALLATQKQTVLANWENVKQELEPVSAAFGVMGKMANEDKTSPLLNMGLRFASDILLKNFVLAKADWVTRLAVPFVMKNYSSHFLADNGKGILSKIKNLGKLFTGRRKNTNNGYSAEESSQYARPEQLGEPA